MCLSINETITMRNLRILITFLFLSNYIYPIIPLRQNEIHTSPQTSASNILLKIDSILKRDFYLNAVKTHEIVLTGKATDYQVPKFYKRL